ncbi:hypothetical protein [Gluconacetobacter tumulisoli]|uniref:Uncharacterized protein n=1 Tax=Gluconacetobacter tumulisoli TaxID=1286189 RepID=A0A7W4K495_9PROT|nr:hypothetical protein [Gluconacetobacter tumulisoli]MBB2200104.1 hypothetical protein [Gluconacetobacter tumulisoli]
METLDFRKTIAPDVSFSTESTLPCRDLFLRNAPEASRAGTARGRDALFIFACDVLSFILSFCVIHLISAGGERLLHPTAPPSHLDPIPPADQVTLLTLMVLIFLRQGHYPGRGPFWDETRIVTLSALGAALLSGAFALGHHASAYALPITGGPLVLFALLAPIARQAARRFLCRGRTARPGHDPRGPAPSFHVRNHVAGLS